MLINIEISLTLLLPMNNNIKEQLQQREFIALKDKHRVILKWATGTGKSAMTIKLVNNAVSSKKMCALFVVAERAHIKNWQEEFTKWNLSDNVSTEIICYNSLHKAKTQYDVIVFDEAHHMFTEKRMSIIKYLKADYIYLLSATLSAQKEYDIERIFGKFTVSQVSLKRAISEDILPDPKVYVIGMELDDTNYTETISTGSGNNLPTVRWENRMQYIYKKKPCIIQCTQRQKYTYITSNMEYWKERYQRSHNPFMQNKWVNLGSQRKRYLGELKTDYIRQLIDLFSLKKRFVCFCASVKQAQELDERNTISSKRPSDLNQKIIDAFNKKQLHRLYAVGMITEGMNLKDIQAGIIVQLDGKERLFIQKFGRSLRAEDPVTYIFYYKDTQDEVYLKNALENIDEKYIEYININQINKSII